MTDGVLLFGASQRTVQRALADLSRAGDVESLGKARSQRWVATGDAEDRNVRSARGIASQMFLVSLLTPDEGDSVNPTR